MGPEKCLSELTRINPGDPEPDKAPEGLISQDRRTEFVTRVTRMRALLSMAKEALKKGEVKRVERILFKAQLVAARLGRTVE